MWTVDGIGRSCFLLLPHGVTEFAFWSTVVTEIETAVYNTIQNYDDLERVVNA